MEALMFVLGFAIVLILWAIAEHYLVRLFKYFIMKRARKMIKKGSGFIPDDDE